MPESREVALGRYVRDRRKYLGLGQSDLGPLGGPSSATVRLIERGEPPDGMQRGTKAGLAKSLKWTAESIDLILAGRQPVELDTPVTDESVGDLAQDGGVLLSLPDGSLDDISAQDREEAVSVAKAALLARIREIRRRVDS